MLTKLDRAPHNGDVVDALWSKIQNSDLVPYMSALKLQYQMKERTFQELPQDIATQIPNIIQASRSFRNVSEVTTNNNNNGNNIDISTVTQDGNCPDEGAYNGDGKLFIETYTYQRWNNLSVKTHHGKIRKAHNKLNTGKGKNNKAGGGNAKWKQNFINKNKRVVSKMQA